MTGFICLYKPEGITSFGAVARVRKIVGEKKAGHCGTLDPLATGVLPIMLGGATRFLEFLPDTTKQYRAVMRLGLTTDTLDISGEVLSRSDVSVGITEIRNALSKYTGDILQVPPMYSALKKDGVKLYELARKGVEVERKARPVTISSLSVTDNADAYEKGFVLSENEYILDITCSSGTYVRTLIDDIGKDLGCGAVMTHLLRTNAACFDISDSVTIEQLEKASEDGSVDDLVVSVEDALNVYPALFVSEGQAKRFSNGGGLDLSKIKNCKHEGLYRVYSDKKLFLGLGEADFSANSLLFKRVYNER